jgi:acyl dehydratase
MCPQGVATGSFPKTRERRFALGDFTIAEISEHVGRELGVSEWVTIDQSRIDAFADLHGRSSVDPR